MLIASPLAGRYADRHGSRTLAAIGMFVSAAGLAAMTTLQVHTPYWQSAIWLAMVGADGPLFRAINKGGRIGTERLSDKAVALAMAGVMAVQLLANGEQDLLVGLGAKDLASYLA